MTTPTNDQIAAVVKYLPILKRPGLKPSTWGGGDAGKDGSSTTPHEAHRREVADLIRDLYANGFIEAFDWSAWQHSAERYVADPGHLAHARLGTLKRLLTTHVRKDRFREGHFASMVKRGHITAILERLLQLSARQ